jgi:hypothetical protein
MASKHCPSKPSDHSLYNIAQFVANEWQMLAASIQLLHASQNNFGFENRLPVRGNARKGSQDVEVRVSAGPRSYAIAGTREDLPQPVSSVSNAGHILENVL